MTGTGGLAVQCTLKIWVPKIKKLFGPILISGFNYMVVFSGQENELQYHYCLEI